MPLTSPGPDKRMLRGREGLDLGRGPPSRKIEAMACLAVISVLLRNDTAYSFYRGQYGMAGQ